MKATCLCYNKLCKTCGSLNEINTLIIHFLINIFNYLTNLSVIVSPVSGVSLKRFSHLFLLEEKLLYISEEFGEIAYRNNY